MDKETLKSWFSRGKKPTAAQFAAWMDSYFHKEDLLPISCISGLAQILSKKADKSSSGVKSVLASTVNGNDIHIHSGNGFVYVADMNYSITRLDYDLSLPDNSLSTCHELFLPTVSNIESGRELLLIIVNNARLSDRVITEDGDEMSRWLGEYCPLHVSLPTSLPGFSVVNMNAISDFIIPVGGSAEVRLLAIDTEIRIQSIQAIVPEPSATTEAPEEPTTEPSGTTTVASGTTEAPEEPTTEPSATTTVAPGTTPQVPPTTEVPGQTLYVSPSGSDQSGDGTTLAPYATLSRALSVASSGDTISMSAGTYVLSSGVSVPRNVSIVGAGNNLTVIDCSNVSTSALELESVQSVDSRLQSISDICFRGGDNCPTAISVIARHNVKIERCGVYNFALHGIFASGESYLHPLENLLINACTVIDSSGSQYGNYMGALTATHLKDPTISYCVFREEKASQGWPIKFWYGGGIAGEDGGFIFGGRIHDCYILKSLFTDFSITIEGKFLYGLEIDHNVICGSIDPNCAYSYDERYVSQSNKYDYGVWIHDNISGFADSGETDAYNTPGWTNPAAGYGVILEMGARDVLIERNVFRNSGIAAMYLRKTAGNEEVHNITIRGNLGYNLQSASEPIHMQCSDSDPSGILVEGLYIYNNILSGSVTNTPNTLINVNRDGWISSLSNVDIFNNILLHANSYAVNMGKNIASYNNLKCHDNIMYDTVGQINSSMTLVDSSNNTISNPNLGPEPHLYLTELSTAAIRTGATLPSVMTDINGVSFQTNNPNMGCYATVGDPATTSIPVTTTENPSVTTEVPSTGITYDCEIGSISRQGANTTATTRLRTTEIVYVGSSSEQKAVNVYLATGYPNAVYAYMGETFVGQISFTLGNGQYTSNNIIYVQGDGTFDGIRAVFRKSDNSDYSQIEAIDSYVTADYIPTTTPQTPSTPVPDTTTESPSSTTQVPIETTTAVPAIVETPNKLVFLHHSTGGQLLADNYGGLGALLNSAGYFISDICYEWDALENSNIGDCMDIGNWFSWFADETVQGNGEKRRDNIMGDVYTEYNRDSYNASNFGAYTRTVQDPGGENSIVIIKSCWSSGDIANTGSASIRGLDHNSATYTIANCKDIYESILPYFKANPDKIFIVFTTPPRPIEEGHTNSTYADNLRTLNTWLYEEWLSDGDWENRNVFVFDYHNIMTDVNNHHRLVNGVIDHTIASGSGNYLISSYHSSGDEHPNPTAQQKAANEFMSLLPHWKSIYKTWRQTTTIPPVSTTPVPIVTTTAAPATPEPTTPPPEPTTPPAATTAVPTTVAPSGSSQNLLLWSNIVEIPQQSTSVVETDNNKTVWTNDNLGNINGAGSFPADVAGGNKMSSFDIPSWAIGSGNVKLRQDFDVTENAIYHLFFDVAASNPANLSECLIDVANVTTWQNVTVEDADSGASETGAPAQLSYLSSVGATVVRKHFIISGNWATGNTLHINIFYGSCDGTAVTLFLGRVQLATSADALYVETTNTIVQ